MSTTLTNVGVLFPDDTTQATAFRKDTENTFTALQTFDASISTENIDVLGSTTLSGPITINGTETVKLKDTSGNNYVAFQAPDSVDYSYILKLPPMQPIDPSVLSNDGSGNLTWGRTDNFGGNRVYASDAYGHDNNDGINQPVRTLKRAAQIAASLGQIPQVDPGVEFYNAKRLLEDNRLFIQEETIGFIATTYPTLVYSSSMCKRDVGLIIDAVVYDMILGGNRRSVEAGQAYYEAGNTSAAIVISSQKTETVAAITFAKNLALAVIQNNTLGVPYQNTVAQIKYLPYPGTSAVSSVTAKFNIITDIINGGTAPSIVEPAFSTIPITIQVASGDFYIDNPIIIPDKVSIIGDSLRSVVIRPLNANKDMFRVRNGAYLSGVTFRDGLNASNVPTYTFNWAIAFDDPYDESVDRTGYFGLANTKPVIFLSPYIQNCSIISFLGGNGVWVDGSKVVSPNIPPNSIEAENPVNLSNGVPEYGKSMIANAFTMVSFGGTGWFCTNDAYAQIVSCFQIFCLNGSYCQSGGYLSITNSATNFGVFSLRASGYSASSFGFDRGYVIATGTNAGAITLTTIGTKRIPVNQYVVRFKDAITDEDITADFKEASTVVTFDASSSAVINISTNIFTIVDHGFSNGASIVYTSEGNGPIQGLLENGVYYINVIDEDTFKIYNDESLSYVVDITALGSGNHKLSYNVEDYYLGETVNSHSAYQELTLAAGTYSFQAGQAITGSTSTFTNTAFVLSYASGTRKLIISNEFTLVEGNLQRILFDDTSTITSVGGTSTSIAVDSVTAIVNEFYTATTQIISTKTGNALQNPANTLLQKIQFHRPSIVNSSAHTWEFAGSGTDYNALPQNGGVGIPAYEQFSQLPGRVYTSGTNELGDFKVGDFILAENKTGNITFRTRVTVGEISVLKLSLSDIEISEFSTDTGLGDNEPSGASDSRVSTQKAVRSFLANRLGNVIDKDVSTNAVPGAVVQLNAQGQINQDLLPPSRGITTYNVDYWGGRLELAYQIPAVQVISGDNASESYNKQTLTIDTATSFAKGDIITQVGQSGYGVIDEAVTLATSITVVNVINDWDLVGDIKKNGTTLTGVNILSIGAVSSIVDNYFLKTDTTSQYLILAPEVVYDFTDIPTVTGANGLAQGTISGDVIYGVAYILDSDTLVAGTGYTPASGNTIYNDVSLTSLSGIGAGATANITVTNGVVSLVELSSGGIGYVAGDTLSASSSSIGGTVTSPFSITILRADTRLPVSLSGGFIKFSASGSSPEYIEDANSTSVNISDLTTYIDKTFNAADVSVGGNVTYSASTITIASHGFTDGDALVYSNGGNLVIGNLINQKTYWVKVVNINTIELYNNYGFTSGSKVIFGTASTGTHRLRKNVVDIGSSTLNIADHGLLVGEVIKFTAPTTAPTGLISGGYYYIGSVTTNGFTLHTNKSDALASTNGVTASVITIGSTGSGSAAFTIQNVQIIGTINTSSTVESNWAQVAQATFDASNIVSGVIVPSRLASLGSANSETFLRGDSSWQYVVQNIYKSPNSPIKLIGNYTSDSTNNFYHESIEIDVDAVTSLGESIDNPGYSNTGVVSLNKSQFDVASYGKSTIKDGVIEAGTLRISGANPVGQNGLYYLTPSNFIGQIPINKGGTGLTTYTRGDLLYSGSADSLTQLNIGVANSVLISNGTIPAWSANLTLAGTLTVSGASATVVLSPSNAAVTISPTGTGSVVVSPATAGSINNMSVGASTRSTGAFTTLAANGATTLTNNTGSTSTTTGTLIVTGGVGISERLYAGSIQNTPIGSVTRSTGAFTTLDANGVVGLSPANAAVTISPTGTGSVVVSPATAGSINNMSVGATTRSTGAFTTLDANGVVGLSPANAAVTISPTGTGSVVINPAASGSINNMSVGASTRSTGAFTTLAANGATTFTSGTTSTDYTSGAVVVTGGVGISENLNVNGSLSVTGTALISGNLVVNGTTTTVNASTLTVNDKNIELGSVISETVSTTGTVGSITGTGPWTATITGLTDTVNLIVGSAITATAGTGSLGSGGVYVVASIVSSTSVTYTATGGTTPTGGTVTNIATSGPTDVTANGGGITLLGTTSKTLSWSSVTSAWTSSEHISLATGKAYYINGTSVLSATALGTAVVSSSLTSVGTIATGTWQGSVISSTYGGTGVNNGGRTLTVATGNITLTAQSGGSSVVLPSTGTLITSSSPTITTPTIAIINGSTADSGTLTLRSTSSAVKSTAGVLLDDDIASTSTTTGTLVVTGGVGISGALNATTKSFIIQHPTKPDQLLRHGSLEGPEFGVYVRGKLIGNIIQLPEYWTNLVNPDTITVQLTPIGKYQKLYVTDIRDNKVYVETDNVFSKEINCFYYILAERCDVDKLEVEGK